MTELIPVEIVYAEPDRVWRQAVQVPTGASVQQALSAMEPSLFPPGLKVLPEFLAVYGRTVRLADALHAHDRIELLRPLTRDPKDTRRLRAADNPLKKPKR